MRAPTTRDLNAKDERKGSNGSESHKKSNSDGGGDARVGVRSPGAVRLVWRLEESTTDVRLCHTSALHPPVPFTFCRNQLGGS